uniref:Uncharacterized protein n=1 Tax=Emiliania huxleyi TaxID=2903 RepID=A0A7S3SR23_EMIHU
MQRENYTCARGNHKHTKRHLRMHLRHPDTLHTHCAHLLSRGSSLALLGPALLPLGPGRRVERGGRGRGTASHGRGRVEGGGRHVRVVLHLPPPRDAQQHVDAVAVPIGDVDVAARHVDARQPPHLPEAQLEHVQQLSLLAEDLDAPAGVLGDIHVITERRDSDGIIKLAGRAARAANAAHKLAGRGEHLHAVVAAVGDEQEGRALSGGLRCEALRKRQLSLCRAPLAKAKLVLECRAVDVSQTRHERAVCVSWLWVRCASAEGERDAQRSGPSRAVRRGP